MAEKDKKRYSARRIRNGALVAACVSLAGIGAFGDDAESTLECPASIQPKSETNYIARQEAERIASLFYSGANIQAINAQLAGDGYSAGEIQLMRLSLVSALRNAGRRFPYNVLGVDPLNYYFDDERSLGERFDGVASGLAKRAITSAREPFVSILQTIDRSRPLEEQLKMLGKDCNGKGFDVSAGLS